MMCCTAVGVEFFNDILVPPDLLLDGARLSVATTLPFTSILPCSSY